MLLLIGQAEVVIVPVGLDLRQALAADAEVVHKLLVLRQFSFAAGNFFNLDFSGRLFLKQVC